MRRLFGFKDKDKSPKPSRSPPSPSPPPTSQHEHERKHGGASAARASPVQQTKPNPGLGLSLPDSTNLPQSSQPSVNPPRRSRHVQFDSDEQGPGAPPLASSSGSPQLHPQPSFESRHGVPSSAVANCIPRSVSSESDKSHASEKPGHPRPQGSSSTTLDQRTTSPLSFAGSYATGSRASPYGYGSSAGFNPSLARLAERDPSVIYQPLTWSEMAHEDLVQNVSTRERTRQEILWEVVASEERYVLELRSLVENYVNPLLHPLLSPPASPSPPSLPLMPASPPPSAAPREELPIAARFLRPINNLSTDSWEQDRRGSDMMPEIESDSSHGHNGGSSASRHSLPAPVRNLPVPIPTSASSASVDKQRSSGSRLASLAGFKPRHEQRAPPSTKLHKASSRAPVEVVQPPPLPDGLRSALEVIPEMLRGHEELSARLKEQWIKAFPLVRGLALIWSDQPWFLTTYATYIVALEEALEAIDRCLPSHHSPNATFALRSKPKTQLDKETKRLARAIASAEERASLEGEAGLAIALSKPLMRLGKLPLLMQSLLYHTDATTVEYEKTRAMALEVDALVRSIEDEKIEEEEREKIRDIMARIEGIKDKAFMAPRSSRTLIEEVPVIPSSSSPSPSTSSPRPSESAPRRAVSESTAIRGRGSTTSSVIAPKKSTRRLSDLMGKNDEKKEWFIRFSDVTLRCVKTGTTDIPGGFSREKEKQGKQGKTKKKGKTRNLYKFIRVERWEMRDMANRRLVSMEDISRSRSGDLVSEDSEESESDDNFDGVSRMSFCYDADDPKPVAPRNFKDDLRPATPKSQSRHVSSSTRNVVAHQTPAKAKFGSRLPASSLGPSGRSRFEAPTAASIARATPTSRVLSPSGGSVTTTASGRPTSPLSSPPAAAAPAKRGLSSPAMTTSVPPSTRPSGRGLHARDESTLGLYEAYWGQSDEAPTVPFPR